MTSVGIPEAVCPFTIHKAGCTAPLHRLAEVAAPWLLPLHDQYLLQTKGETKTFQNTLSLNCSADPLRKNTAKAGSTFPPPELHSPSNPSFQDMHSPSTSFECSFYPEKNRAMSSWAIQLAGILLTLAGGWFGCQECFPCHTLWHLSFSYASQPSFHEVLSLQDFIIDTGMIVEVPKNYSIVSTLQYS